ncbi:MAG: alpha/beta hydrolase [Brevibacillus sp.]|nr:alpha/beta hydrolase [Brevibacillus sp.]
MSQVVSKDGTVIEFDRTGSGPPLILVLGAFNDRTTGAPLAKHLERNFTVINYDRRGKGASGDTMPYSIEKEIDDLNTLIEEAGGSPLVFGYSSGAILALKATANKSAISKLVLYEPPFGKLDSRIVDRLEELVNVGNRGEAVEYFQSKMVGIPDEIVAQLRHAPFRPHLEAIAHTTVYDTKIVGASLLPEELNGITTPVLVIAGEQSSDQFKQSNQSLSTLLPNGQYVCLEGQSHHIDASVLAPVITQYFIA